MTAETGTAAACSKLRFAGFSASFADTVYRGLTLSFTPSTSDAEIRFRDWGLQGINDAPWGLHFQAGKTEFDGKRRIIHAYLQRADSDYAKHVYGGCMALPRELYLDEHGGVATRLVPEIIAACKKDATGGKGATVFTARHSVRPN